MAAAAELEEKLSVHLSRSVAVICGQLQIKDGGFQRSRRIEAMYERSRVNILELKLAKLLPIRATLRTVPLIYFIFEHKVNVSTHANISRQ